MYSEKKIRCTHASVMVRDLFIKSVKKMSLSDHILLQTTRTGKSVKYAERAYMMMAADSGMMRTSAVGFVCGVSEFNTDNTMDKMDNVTSMNATLSIPM